MVEMQDFIVLTLAQVRELLADVDAKVEDARREGYDEGNEAGYEVGFEHGSAQGYDDGFANGVADGYDDGFEDGGAYERAEAEFRAAEQAAFS
jgi:flagellar assembly protein FliH